MRRLGARRNLKRTKSTVKISLSESRADDGRAGFYFSRMNEGRHSSIDQTRSQSELVMSRVNPRESEGKARTGMSFNAFG